MKHIYTILLLLFSINSTAQPGATINKSIDDNGKVMKLKLEGNAYGKDFRYSGQRNVGGLSVQQKDSVVNHVIDSLSAISLQHANGKYKVKKEIEDLGVILKVKIHGEVYGRNIRYYNEYDVKGMTPLQKDSIVNRLIDVLKLNYVAQ